MPEPLWQAKYDPYPAWLAMFQELQAPMIEQHGSTDACLAAVESERRTAAATLTRTAAELLREALAAHKPH